MKEEVKPLAIYTSEEAAAIVGISVISIHRYIKRGLLKATVLGRHYRITGQAILDFLEQNTKIPTTDGEEREQQE